MPRTLSAIRQVVFAALILFALSALVLPEAIVRLLGPELEGWLADQRLPGTAAAAALSLLLASLVFLDGRKCRLNLLPFIPPSSRWYLGPSIAVVLVAAASLGLRADQRLLIFPWLLVVTWIAAEAIRTDRESFRMLAAWGGTRSEQLLLMSLVFLLLLSGLHRAGSVEYFLYGDEAEFHILANAIADGRFTELVFGLGGHGEHPAFASVLPALTIALFGDSIYSFRAPAIVFCGLSLIPLHLAARILAGKKAAWITSVVFAANFYLFQFSVFGYNNSLIIFFTSLTLLFGVMSIQFGSRGALVLSGIAAGLSIYTNYFGFLLVVAVLPLPLLLVNRGGLPALFSAAQLVVLGCLVAAIPLFTNLGDHTEKILAQHVAPLGSEPELNSTASHLGALETLYQGERYLAENFVQGTLIPLGFRGGSHYTNGRWFSPIAGVLFLLGIFSAGAAAFRACARSQSWCLLLWALTVTGIALTSKYQHLPPTRAPSLVPLISVLCGIGFSYTEQCLRSVNRAALFTGVIASILMFNLSELRAYREQFRNSAHSEVHVIHKAISAGARPMVIYPSDWSDTFRYFNSLYDWGLKVRLVELHGRPPLASLEETIGAEEDLTHIFVHSSQQQRLDKNLAQQRFVNHAVWGHFHQYSRVGYQLLH